MKTEVKALEVEIALVRPKILLVVGSLSRHWNLVDNINWYGVSAVYIGHESAAWSRDPSTPFVIIRPLDNGQRLAADYLRSRGHPELTEAQVRRLFDVRR